jgi:hypothetical protein
MCCNCRKMHGCEAEMAHKLFLIHLLSEVYLPVTSNKPFDDGHPTLTYCLSSFHYFCSDPCILCNWQPFVGIWHTFTVVKFAFVYSSSIAQLLLQLLASVWSIRDLEKTNRFLLIYRGGITTDEKLIQQKRQIARPEQVWLWNWCGRLLVQFSPLIKPCFTSVVLEGMSNTELHM